MRSNTEHADKAQILSNIKEFWIQTMSRIWCRGILAAKARERHHFTPKRLTAYNTTLWSLYLCSASGCLNWTCSTGTTHAHTIIP